MTAELLPIAGASEYGITADGWVYNTRTGRRLTRKWYGNRWHTTIRDDGGRACVLDHARRSVLPSSVDDVRPIPDYPKYSITPYGAVYRDGRLLADHERHGRRYVRLMNKFGRRHNKRVDTLVAAVWP